MLSARGVDKAPDNAMFRSEQALAATGLPSVVVRPSWFAQNFTEGADRRCEEGPASMNGFAPSPVGATTAPSRRHRSCGCCRPDRCRACGAYDLSGPRALSFAEAAAVLSPHVGRGVHHVDLPVEEWTTGAVSNGLPAPYAQMLGTLFTLIRDGYDAHVSDGVQRALGRPGTSFEDWATREAGSLR